MRFNCIKELFSMGFQSRESGVPGEGSFPACQHSSTLRGEGDGAPSAGPEAHFHSSRIQPPLCGPGLPRAAAAAGEQSPIHPQGRLPPGHSRPQMGWPRRPILQTRARGPARRAQGPIQEAGSGQDDLGFCLSGLHGEDRPKPAFVSGTGTCGHGVFSPWKSSVYSRLIKNEDVRFHGSRPGFPPLSLGMVRPKVPKL